MRIIIAACTEQSRSLRIFVVEGHPDTLLCFSLYLQSLGHTVMSARTMTEALAKWPQAQYDVFISELRLPDGDGWELLEHLHVSRLVYTLAFTSLGMPADRARSQVAGYRHHLLKPICLQRIDAALQEAAHEIASR